MSKEDIPRDQLGTWQGSNPAPPKKTLFLLFVNSNVKENTPQALLGFHTSKNSSKVLHLEHKAVFLSYKDCHAFPHSLSKKRREKGVLRLMHWSPRSTHILHQHRHHLKKLHLLYWSDLFAVNVEYTHSYALHSSPVAVS